VGGYTHPTNFWTVYVSTAFEASPAGVLANKIIDNDPGNQANAGSLLGITDSQAKQISLVFLESVRDRAATVGLPFATEVARNGVHEVGHQFNIARVPRHHRPDPDNIMYGGGIESVTDANFIFNPNDLAYLRLESRSPGSRGA